MPDKTAYAGQHNMPFPHRIPDNNSQSTYKSGTPDLIRPQDYDNIKTGLYNIQTAYYAVIRKDEPENSDARKLLNAMISTYGQKVAKEAGYVQNY